MCFLPIHSGHQVRWTYRPGSHRRKVTQDFSSTFFPRCVPSFFLREGCSHSFPSSTVKSNLCTNDLGACHYLTNRFQMKAPVAPSRSLREAFKRAPRSLRGACLREGFAEPPRRHHEPFAEVYEPFAEVAHTEGSTKTPWRVHEASSKGPWMNCMFLLDHDCNRVWSILYCF